MHKNTVYQKIEKLKEFFHVDVNDLYAYVKLYVSWSSSNRCPYMIQMTS